ncbi:hypothetical protein THOG11_170099 [Vibrio harveyi]|nr:hypothetical protein TH15OA1_350099 [Vibrio harveyi]CAH1552826.1 hypothetical protein THOD03_170099 [Vibrio harveyi]CAH1559185.1 hypothetical protein THOG11_170099 [Vibrio harveyi]
MCSEIRNCGIKISLQPLGVAFLIRFADIVSRTFESQRISSLTL